jgi:serine/threonine protein kinase
MSGAILDDRYQLGPLVLEDVYGELYRGEQVRLSRGIWVRLLPPSSMPRFEGIAQTLATLQHPNILYLIDRGVHAQRPYLVWELVSGSTLAEALETRDRWAPEDVLPILVAIADGLDHAHKSGVIHRDLRPASILLGDDGRARICDLGLAMIVDADLRPEAWDLLAAPSPYLAPEIAKGRGGDGRADLYALGAIAHHLLLGRPPYEASTRGELIALQDRTAPKPLGPHLPKEAASLALAIDRLLARSPEERYPSATWAVNALRAAGTQLTLPDMSAHAELLRTQGGQDGISVHDPKEKRELPKFPEPSLLTPARIRAVDPPVTKVLPHVPDPASVPPAAKKKKRSNPPAPPPPSDEVPVVPLKPPKNETLDIDFEFEAADRVDPSHTRAPIGRAIALLLGLTIAYAYAILELPDPAKRARNLVRAGKSKDAVQVLEPELASGIDRPRIDAAMAHAKLSLGDTSGALAHYERAAKDPSRLEPADWKALFVLLAARNPDSLIAERILERSGPLAREGLRALRTSDDRYVKCRASDALFDLGEQIDLVAICMEALEVPSCAARAVIARRLTQIRDRRALPAIERAAAHSSPAAPCADTELKDALEVLRPKDKPPEEAAPPAPAPQEGSPPNESPPPE